MGCHHVLFPRKSPAVGTYSGACSGACRGAPKDFGGDNEICTTQSKFPDYASSRDR